MGRDLDAASVRTWILHKYKLASVNLSTLTSYAGIVGNSHEEKHRVAPYGGMPFFTLRRYLSLSTPFHSRKIPPPTPRSLSCRRAILLCQPPLASYK